MRAFTFFFGLLLVGLGLGGQGILPQGGHSAKSALPNVVLGLVVWLTGPNARLYLVALGAVYVVLAILPFAWAKKQKS